MISINLCYFCEKMFSHMNIWMIGKNSVKAEKEDSYCHLNMITDADYMHGKRLRKDFEINNLGEYHELYVQGDTSLLDDTFEKFQNIYLEIYESDPVHFLTAPELAWQVAIKKTKIKLVLLTDVDMLLMHQRR